MKKPWYMLWFALSGYAFTKGVQSLMGCCTNADS